MERYETTELLYENLLAGPDDVEDWTLEDDGAVSSLRSGCE